MNRLRVKAETARVDLNCTTPGVGAAWPGYLLYSGYVRAIPTLPHMLSSAEGRTGIGTVFFKLVLVIVFCVCHPWTRCSMSYNVQSSQRVGQCQKGFTKRKTYIHSWDRSVIPTGWFRSFTKNLYDPVHVYRVEAARSASPSTYFLGIYLCSMRTDPAQHLIAAGRYRIYCYIGDYLQWVDRDLSETWKLIVCSHLLVDLQGALSRQKKGFGRENTSEKKRRKRWIIDHLFPAIIKIPSEVIRAGQHTHVSTGHHRQLLYFCRCHDTAPVRPLCPNTGGT